MAWPAGIANGSVANADDIITALDSLQAQIAAAGPPPGAVIAFGGDTAPDGWLLCDGSAVSRTTYGDLFDAIGTTYGTGNGSTTFNLPDFTDGRGPIGPGTGYDLGDTGGAATVTLTEAQIPSHTHTFGRPRSTNSGQADAPSTWYNLTTSGSTDTFTSGATGGGGSHENHAPYQVINFLVKT